MSKAKVASAGSKDPKLPPKSYFKSYHSFEQHVQFLSDLQKSFSKNSEVFVAGKSVQNREIKGIHLWGKGDKGRNPAIVWHANSHAREWISGMVGNIQSSRSL